MSKSSIEFLKHVLGEDGQKAFERADKRSGGIGVVLAPRTIVGWLSAAIKANYEGEIPGIYNSYISLQKHNNNFSGALTIEEQVYDFQEADILHVAASIAVALGLEDIEIPRHLKNSDISKLGKSIDMLVKARVIAKAMSEDIQNSLVKTAEPAGPAAEPVKPQKQIAPIPTIPPTPKPADSKSALPKPPKPPKGTAQPESAPVTKKELKVSKGDAENKVCPECGGKLFKHESFTGCACFKALSKSVKTTVTDDGYSLRFSSAWDMESFSALIQVLLGAANEA